MSFLLYVYHSTSSGFPIFVSEYHGNYIPASSKLTDNIMGKRLLTGCLIVATLVALSCIAACGNSSKSGEYVDNDGETKEVLCDTLILTYFNYNDKDNTSIGKLIRSKGATEIEQPLPQDANRRNKYDGIILPARIARVAKGNRYNAIDRVYYILNDDVIKYFGLSHEYNTPLKVKNFYNSPETSWFLNEFAAVKEQLRNHTFYLAIPINSEYDLKEGTFKVKLPFYRDFRDVTASENRILDHTYLPQNINGIKDSFITLQVDETLATKIEGRGYDLVIFGKLKPDLEVINEYGTKGIIFNPSSYYVVSRETGDILTGLRPGSTD